MTETAADQLPPCLNDLDDRPRYEAVVREQRERLRLAGGDTSESVLLGLCMRAVKGRANPAVFVDLIRHAAKEEK